MSLFRFKVFSPRRSSESLVDSKVVDFPTSEEVPLLHIVSILSQVMKGLLFVKQESVYESQHLVPVEQSDVPLEVHPVHSPVLKVLIMNQILEFSLLFLMDLVLPVVVSSVPFPLFLSKVSEHEVLPFAPIDQTRVLILLMNVVPVLVPVPIEPVPGHQEILELAEESIASPHSSESTQKPSSGTSAYSVVLSELLNPFPITLKVVLGVLVVAKTKGSAPWQELKVLLEHQISPFIPVVPDFSVPLLLIHKGVVLTSKSQVGSDPSESTSPPNLSHSLK